MNPAFSVMQLLQIGLLVVLIGTKYVHTEGLPLIEMEELFDTETQLIKNLEGYISAQETKIAILKKKVNEFQRESTKAGNDADYLLNPINAFLLTKRLSSDWKQVQGLMDTENGIAFADNITEFRETFRFPTEDDLNGAAVALMNLQDTYNLPTSEIARGELNGIQYSSQMSLSDCFELGRQSYLNEDYYHTKLWMAEALVRLHTQSNKTRDDVDITRVDILEYLAFSVYQQGDIVDALRLTDELLKINPSHALAKSNKVHFEQEIKHLAKKEKNKNSDVYIQPNLFRKACKKAIRQALLESDRKINEKLCRGEIKPIAAQLNPLRCRYVSHRNAFLKLAPFKAEEASLNPYIIIYHDVLYNDEMEFIKKTAQPKLRRPNMKNPKNGKWHTPQFGTIKGATFKDSEHRYIRAITQRSADMSNLNMKTAENLQAVNYGIGGKYESYFDFDEVEEENIGKGMDTSNRIATLLFSMSDVGQGGATVFPAIHTAINLKKGSAAFWYNFYHSGEPDSRTRYAVCPVLKGSKWISNKWMHERGQEFQRPCLLSPDHPQSE